MRDTRSPTGVLLALLLAAAAAPVTAQTPEEPAQPQGQPPPPVSNQVAASDRLYLSFIEDAALVDRQWWEGDLLFIDGQGYDAVVLGGTAAFQPWAKWELGARVGFGNSDTPGSLPEGSGATDLDIWGKYHFGPSGGATEFAVGTTITVPTGDDTVGLGFDAFSASGWGAMRYIAKRFTFSGHLGFRYNGNGRQFGFDLSGRTSGLLGGGVFVPLGRQLTLVAELDFESERFTGLDADTRLLGGVNYRVFASGIFRAALGFGLTDGAPDAQLILGYAATF